MRYSEYLALRVSIRRAFPRSSPDRKALMWTLDALAMKMAKAAK